MTRNVPHRTLTIAGGLITALVAIAACSKGTAPSAETQHSQMHAISRAVFTDGRLWLLQDDGSLASLTPKDNEARPASTPGKLLEICNSAGRLTGLIEDHGKWSLQTRSADRWIVVASVPTEGDTFVALDCNDSDPITVVTNRRLEELTGGRARSVNLRQPLQGPLVTGTTLGTPDALWLGFNSGEWGGGLRRISRSDGTVQTVERNRTGELCGGPLNSACDPVNGIIAAPWNPACIVVAIGLVHMMAHGRIVEVCGNSVRRLYFKPLDPQPPRNKLDEGEAASTVAFFGLTRTGSSWWAIGIDGLYRFDGAHEPEFRPLPKFENKGGYWVSFDIPELALVLTDVNQRRSISGSVPIMAVR
jgi:hypothetical protein